MKRLATILALLALTACHHPSPMAGPAGVTTIVRTSAVRDSTATRAGAGQLRVVIRAVDEPAEALVDATIRLWRGGADSLPAERHAASADVRGTVAFDSVPAGEWHLDASRLGYQRYQIPVRAVAGCRTVVELYLAYSITCLFDCPTTAPRAVVTTCA